MIASAVVVGLKCSVLIFGYVLVVACLLLIIHVALTRHHESAFPDSAIIARLSRLVDKIENEPDKWTDISFKQELMVLLESLAICTDRYLPRKQKSGDLVTDAWMKERTGKIAQTFRNWKQWVLTPMPDTRDVLLSQLGSTLVSAALGHWDSMERTDVDVRTREKLWHVKIISAARTIFAGALISGLIFCVRLLPGIHAPFSLIYLGPAYAIFSLINIIDPTIVTKTEFFKNVKDIVMLEKK